MALFHAFLSIRNAFFNRSPPPGISWSVKSFPTIKRNLIGLKVQEYVTSIRQHIPVFEIVFYVNCNQLQCQMQWFSRQFIWTIRNREKRVVRGLSELNGGAGKVRWLCGMFVKLCGRSIDVHRSWKLTAAARRCDGHL